MNVYIGKVLEAVVVETVGVLLMIGVVDAFGSIGGACPVEGGACPAKGGVEDPDTGRTVVG